LGDDPVQVTQLDAVIVKGVAYAYNVLGVHVDTKRIGVIG
jgi:hypothetical protein